MLLQCNSRSLSLLTRSVAVIAPQSVAVAVAVAVTAAVTTLSDWRDYVSRWAW